MHETEKPQTADKQLPEALILGRILLLQSTLHAELSVEGLGDFLDAGLSRIPGIKGAALCIHGSLHGNVDVFGIHLPEQCRLASNADPFETDCGEHCLAKTNGSSHAQITLRTSNGILGSLLVAVNDRAAYAIYSPFIENTANLVALLCENRRKDTALEKLNLDLEEKVASRTAALEERDEYMRETQRIARLGNFTSLVEGGEHSWSDEMYEIFGLDPTSFSPTREGFFSLLHPEEKESLIQLIQHSLETGERIAQDYRAKHASGEWRHYQTIASAFFDEHGTILGLRGTTQDITDRKQTEDALRERDARLREAQHVAQMGSFSATRDENEVVWSDELYQIFGLTKNTYVPTKKSFYDLLHPDDNESYREAVLHTLNTGDPLIQKYRAKHSSGEWRHYQTTASAHFDDVQQLIGLQGTVQDITRVIEVEAEKEEYYARSVGIIKNSADAIITIDENSIIESINPAATHQFGYEESELVGKSVTILMPTRYHQKNNDYLNEFTNKPDNVLDTFREVEALRKDGTTFPVRMGISEVKFGDKRIFAGIIHDLTHETELEQQLVQAQKLESLGTLASGIAHDLNNILAPIAMSTQMLRKDELSKQSESTLAIIEEAAARGAAIVKQVLTFARVGQGNKTRVSVADTIEEVKHFLSNTFPKNINLEISFEEGLWSIYGDGTQLHQILLNLSVNARDAMPEGGHVKIHAKNVIMDETYSTMILDAQPGFYILIEVSDTGTGINDEILTKIFDPFFTTKEIGEGTGLGLSTVSGIVQEFGGFLRTESEIGQGTCFSIYLPAVLEDDTTPLTDAGTSLPPRGSGETILIVDDEEMIRDITQTTLEGCGYTTLTASDGADGIAQFARPENDVRLVITDIMMPHMDGIALIRAIRSIRPTVPIIATTGLKDQVDIDKSLKVDAVLAKPHTAEELLFAMDEALKSRLP